MNLVRKKSLSFKIGTMGAALVEFAIVIPLFLFILMAGYQAFQYIMLNMKLDAIAGKIATWVSADTTRTNIQDCFIGAWLLDQTDNFSTLGQVIVSGVTSNATGHNTKLAWQVTTPSAVSSIILTNDNNQHVASAPFTFANEQQLIVVEVKYSYTPFFSSLSSIFPAVTLYKVAQMVPQSQNQFNSFS